MMVIYIGLVGVGGSKRLGRDIFWLKNSGFAKEASFVPKTAISAMSLKLQLTSCHSLS